MPQNNYGRYLGRGRESVGLLISNGWDIDMPRDDELFNGLVANALDFINAAIDSIEKQPKYAVIHFCAGVELLLKARLMVEHWSQILKQPDKADLSKFRSGDFVSVSIEDAIVRLDKVVGEQLPKPATDSLNKLRIHRNRLIHFFNPAYGADPDDEVVAEVVAELCKAWFHLYQLMTGSWKLAFKVQMGDFRAADRRMHKLRPFLRAKFDALSDALAEVKRTGGTIAVCPACGFEAGREEVVLGPLHRLSCLICKTSTDYLKVACPSCDEELRVAEGQTTCEGCDATIGLEDLLEMFGEEKSPKEAFEEAPNAMCGACESYTQTAVPIDNEWLCLACYAVADETSDCEWCNERLILRPEDTFWTGCHMCEGRLGHMKEDD